MTYTENDGEKEKPETVENPMPENVDNRLEEIAADFIDNMPEVSEHAVEAHLAKEKAAQNAPLQTDKSGVIFDPTIHTLGTDGNPLLTKTGLYARKRGRKAGQSTLGSIPGPTQPGKPIPAVGEQNGAIGNQKVSPAVMGAVAASLTVQGAMMLLGKDLAPDAKNALTGVSDMETLTAGYRDYFIATNRQDFPPLMALCFCVGSYAAPKLIKPDAVGRVKIIAVSLWEGSAKLWRKFKAWRNKE